MKKKKKSKKKKRKAQHEPGQVFIKSFVSLLIGNCRNTASEDSTGASDMGGKAKGGNAAKKKTKKKKKGELDLPSALKGKKAMNAALAKENVWPTLLKNFASDLIRVVCLPEWPAAEQVLKCGCGRG